MLHKEKLEEIEVAKRTKLVEIGVHHIRCCPTVVCPPPHHQIGSDRLVLLILLLLLFFQICLFWFNFIVRIGFCFVFCVWIMWDVFWEWSKETETKTKCSLGQIRCFLISFYFYSNSLLVDIFFPTKNSKYSGMVPFKTLNFLFLKRDIWEL